MILTSQNYQFYAPARIIHEVRKKKQLICNLSGFSELEFEEGVEALLRFIKVLEFTEYELYMGLSKEVIASRDPTDTEYIACALSVHADFIWSNDKDFTAQSIILVKTTSQFIEEGKSA